MAEEQEQYVVLEGSAIALPEDENGIITYQLTDDVNQAGIYRLVNALPASSFTLGFDMSIEDHDGESLFVIELADDYKAFRIAHTISPSSVTTVIDMDWKTYDGENKHYDIHTSTFEGALLPLVNGIWELSMINGFMSLSIDENLIIDNLDVEPYPISLDSGIVVVRAISTDTPVVQTIHDVFLEPVIVFDNHVYFSKSVLAEKYENLTWEDLGSNAQFSNVQVVDTITTAIIDAQSYLNLPPTSWGDIIDKPSITSSQWTTYGTNIAYNNGYVGVGITSPSSTLQVNGDFKCGAIDESYFKSFANSYFGGFGFMSDTEMLVQDQYLGLGKYAIGYYSRGVDGWERKGQITTGQSTVSNFGGLASRFAVTRSV